MKCKGLFIAPFIALVVYCAAVKADVIPLAKTTTCSFNAADLCSTRVTVNSESLDSQFQNPHTGQFYLAPIFNRAFQLWNSQNANLWTLDTPIGSLGESFNLSFDVKNNGSVGGAYIDVQVVNSPTLGADQSLVWVQGLFLNYTVSNSLLVNPYYILDVTPSCGGGVSCAPAYPIQYPDFHFFDGPQASFQPGGSQAFFDANAYLAIEDTTDSKHPQLIPLDGVSYGFYNFIPEPATLPIFGAALMIFGMVRLRKRGRSIGPVA